LDTSSPQQPDQTAEPPPPSKPAGASLPADAPATAAATPSDPELHAYIRRSVIKALVVLLLAVVLLGFSGVYFKAELLAATAWVLRRVGLVGIAAILFISDAFCAPISSDFTLVVIANSELRQDWYYVVPALALWSSFAGGVAWYLGTKVGHMPWATRWLGRLRSGQNHALVAKLGKWGVALGALTPIPYSLTCWAAGMLELTIGEIFWVNLLRVPRFIAYYLAFAHSDELLRLLLQQ
jgi:membrane protein YqaA with SNARE-associated domain